MKTSNIILLSIGLVALAILAAFGVVYAKHVKNNPKDSKSTDPLTGPVELSATPVLDQNRSLSIGSKGAEVSELQKVLNASGRAGSPLVVDGAFGGKTLNALILLFGFGTVSTTLAKTNAKLASLKDNSSTETKSFLGGIFGTKF